MPPKDDPKKGIALLSFDGGRFESLACLSSVVIFEEIMTTVEDKMHCPKGTLKAAEHFDLIVGTGTGGLFALFLGPLRMSTEDAVKYYIKLHKAVFSSDQDEGSSLKEQRDRILEKELKRIISKCLGKGKEETRLSATQSCKSVITAMTAANLSTPVCFRTYKARKQNIECTVLQAAQVTLADPKLFSTVPITTRPRIKERFVSATFGWNNPIMQLVDEAKDLFPTRSISCIISIGAGHPGHISLDGTPDGHARTALAIAQGCEQIANDVASQLAGSDEVYFRFNVEQGLQACFENTLTPGEVLSHVRAYMSRQAFCDKRDLAVQALKERPLFREVAALLQPKVPMLTKIIEELAKAPKLTAEAVQRNNAVNSLPYAEQAYFNSRQCCLPGTRVQLLSAIRTWIRERGSASHVLWLDGPLGSGKSFVFNSVASEAKESGILASAFFLTAGATANPREGRDVVCRASVQNLVTTLIRDLAGLSPAFREAVGSQLDVQPALATVSPIEQFRQLLVPNISHLPQQPLLWIIDGFEELQNRPGSDCTAHDILELLRYDLPRLRAHFQVLIASRSFPNNPLLDEFTPHVHHVHVDLTAPSNITDMKLIASAELLEVTRLNRSFRFEPQRDNALVTLFTNRAGGLPLWLRVARSFLIKSSDPRTDLDGVLKSRTPDDPDYRKKMEELYGAILNETFHWSDLNEKERKRVAMVVDILVALQRPFGQQALLEFYQDQATPISPAVIEKYLSLLRPFLLRDEPLEFIHWSLRDYLSSPGFVVSVNVPSFLGQGTFGHPSLLVQCSTALKKRLLPDAPGVGYLKAPYKPDYPLPVLSFQPSPLLLYSSSAWMSHLRSSPSLDMPGFDQFCTFLNKGFERWLEFETCAGTFPLECCLIDDIEELSHGQKILSPLYRREIASALYDLAKRLRGLRRPGEARNAEEVALRIMVVLQGRGEVRKVEVAAFKKELARLRVPIDPPPPPQDPPSNVTTEHLRVTVPPAGNKLETPAIPSPIPTAETLPPAPEAPPTPPLLAASPVTLVSPVTEDSDGPRTPPPFPELESVNSTAPLESNDKADDEPISDAEFDPPTPPPATIEVPLVNSTPTDDPLPTEDDAPQSPSPPLLDLVQGIPLTPGTSSPAYLSPIDGVFEDPPVTSPLPVLSPPLVPSSPGIQTSPPNPELSRPSTPLASSPASPLPIDNNYLEDLPMPSSQLPENVSWDILLEVAEDSYDQSLERFLDAQFEEALDPAYEAEKSFKELVEDYGQTQFSHKLLRASQLLAALHRELSGEVIRSEPEREVPSEPQESDDDDDDDDERNVFEFEPEGNVDVGGSEIVDEDEMDFFHDEDSIFYEFY
ncbi:hypothetical protein DL96DRAFT_1705077 [Flagelloscypha sp. PMI_526]|nr:hypothetical protein DL96DRAFT_1705077 [Flagelloscypha sp. PMI_526]